MYSELAIIGTTASGKSDLAIKVAREFNAVILSLDSLCLYKEIDIASAKPNKDELELISHFGVDLVMPDMDFCVGDFIDEYKKAKLYAQQNNSMLIITGGSGFYLKSMLSGLSPKIEPLKIEISDDEIWDLAVEIDRDF